ncbi:MAG: DUF928 domain-containing protein [Myxococcota bacterium]
MSCRRALDVDLAAFRLEPHAAEFEAFRLHYPACPDCARAVAAWSALEADLRDLGADSAHPSEERLLVFQSEPGSLDAAERKALTAHVAGCVQCRNELDVLRGFDFAALAEGAGASDEEGRGWLARLAAALGMPQPALALTVLIVLALPAAWLLLQGGADPTADPAPPIARREAPAPAPPPVVPEAAPVAPTPEPVVEEPPVEIARPTPPDPVVPETVPTPDEAPAVVPEPMRIAALLPGDLPLYAPDAALSGGPIEALRMASVVRSGGPELPTIRALGPDHLGLTSLASPTLYWSLDAATDVPVELSIVSEEDPEPLLEVRVPAPRAGVHALDLAEHGVTLPVGTPLSFFASLVPDEARRDDDVVSGAGLLRVEPGASLRERLEEAPPERRAHVLAGAGYWYDAFATVSDWLAAEPDAEGLRAYRDALIGQLAQ